MSKSRWSIKNTLRQVRGARGAADRARVRYAKQDAIELLLRLCMARLTDAERALLEANQRAALRELYVPQPRKRRAA
jgi:hypothetical protein